MASKLHLGEGERWDCDRCHSSNDEGMTVTGTPPFENRHGHIEGWLVGECAGCGHWYFERVRYTDDESVVVLLTFTHPPQ